MALEELDEVEVLWPDTSLAHAAHEPPSSPRHLPVRPSAPCAKQRCSARSRPLDVPKAARSSHRWNGKDGGHEEDKDGGNAIVPPHLLVSGRRRSEAETAWTTLRGSGPPCKRARDLHHLRDSVLRMTGFIEG